MAVPGCVLVLTHRFDPTADKVVEELNAREVPVFRCDAADFPERLAVAAELRDGVWRGRLQGVRRSASLTDLAGIYYRRPTGFEFHPQMSTNERRWSAIQARMGFGGLLASVEPWLNHPHHIGFAEYKPVQLRLAESCGLRVPRTVLTNKPEVAREFVTELGRAVCKPFVGTGVCDDDGFRQVFSSVVQPEACDDPNIARTMHMFQEWVPKDHEVRLTVVDDQFHAARIDSMSESAYVDWRSDYDSVRYTAVAVPDLVRSCVRRLLDGLRLRFAALDFVIAPDGTWWFLECNPNGQWAWIEDETGMPIASSIADSLTRRIAA